jgi:hypothetical protein
LLEKVDIKEVFLYCNQQEDRIAMTNEQFEELRDAAKASNFVLKSFLKHVKTLIKDLREEGKNTGVWSESITPLQTLESDVEHAMMNLANDWCAFEDEMM